MDLPKGLLGNDGQQYECLKIIRNLRDLYRFYSPARKVLGEVDRDQKIFFEQTVGDEEDEGLLEVERCVGDMLSNANNRACVPERPWPWA